MNFKSKIRIAQLFDTYSNFYQPYIPPVMESLKKNELLEVDIFAFNGDNTQAVNVFPGYYKRKLIEKFYSLSHNSKIKLNYAERSFQKQNIDIVHVQHSYLFSKVMGLLSLPSNERPKIIITLRGGDTYIKPWVSNKWKGFYNTYGKKVDAFITMSEHQKQYVTRWGVPIEKIHVIPISFGNRFEIAPKAPNIEKLKLVSVFRMCWEKNITENLLFVKKIKEIGVTVCYHIYGDGPDLGQVYYLRDKYNLTNEIVIKGRVENSEIKKKLREYDFILQLSLSEAFPTSILEAQAFGVPAIVSDSGGLPEAVINERTGIVGRNNHTKETSEKIISIWKDHKLFKKFSENAINHAQTKFNTNVETEKLLTLYKSFK